MARSSRLGVALILATALAACAAPPPKPDVTWADLSPIAGSFLGTDLISRAAPASLAALGKGWSVDVDTGLADGFWAVGSEAQANLVAVREGVHELVFEAMPPAGMDQQLLSLGVNGRTVGEPLTLPAGWSRQRVRLADDDLVIGDNHLRLSFRNVSRPNDLLPESQDARPLAARFRFVQLVALDSDRQLDEDADADVLLSGGDTAPEQAPAIPPAVRTGSPWMSAVLTAAPTGADDGAEATEQLVVQADSIIQVAVRVPPQGRWVGTANAAPPAGGGTVQWIAECLTDDGQRTELGRGSSGSLDADLDAWAGQEVLLRLRTTGSRGSAVLWSGMGLSDPQQRFDREALLPPALPAASTSGRLGRPDIIFIMLDAARPDFFSTYRGTTPTPAVDALASAGTRFENAYAAAPWTNQSVYSLLTGRYPEAHGVAGWRDTPARDIRTLFQLTYAAGYHTVLWAEHPLYRSSRALRYDVDQYIDMRIRERMGMREKLSRPDIFRPEQPTFAMFHLLPPHAPYLPGGNDGPPAPWANSMMRDFRTDFDLSPSHLESFSRAVDGAPPSDDDLHYAAARYQDNLRYADELVRRIVEGLRRAGRYDDALIVLMSDHGEAFYEHGHFLHTWPLYDEMLRIPLVIKWPKSAEGFQRAIDRPVTNVDLAPTVIDAIGFQGDDPGHQGNSLLPLVFGEFFPSRDLFASTVGVSNGVGDDEPLKPMGAVIETPYKLIHDKVSGRIELYDLEADPGETVDLAAAQPLRAQLLLQSLFLQERADLRLNTGAEAGATDAEVDPEMLKQLCALGYVQC